jgi:3-hydroxyisobutyrate dehydrogenase-like beta-hydroxyacid dehydrogenase
MCKNVVEKANLSKPIIIYDIAERRTQEIHAQIGHSTIAISIAEAAAKADIIFYSVSDDRAVLSVLNEILTTDIRGKLVVDCSTVHPDTTMQEAQAVESKGGSFVACPVFGAAAMADAGQLICVLAGKDEAVEKVKPFCKGVMGKEIIDLSGDEPGKATLMKIIGNTFVLNMVEALSEGHVVAEKSGLGTQQLHKFIEIMFPGAYTSYSNRLISGDYYKRKEPLFSVELARKDARHAQSIAHKAGMEMKNVELGDSYLKVVQEQRGSNGELAAIYGAKRLEAGLPFEN